jgi:chaperonin GroES|tara:strand:+ start:601 stop:912 length:312 start_codon:yes stop_codon:yes gene_type:complete
MTTSAKSATDLNPMSDRVVIRPSELESVTAGGIFLPDTAQERPQQGEVVATGPGRVLSNGKRIDMEVKPGDTVIYSKYAGTEIAVEAEDLLVMGSNDILAILS